ncbi:MAG: Holliday junction resolvase RuvX [Candidatus Coatesbacteria bacterium]|nr:MAG: Holliday junction resolvase RuvX [Candidatus Coatesbacteria bacterium]RLC44795.1 MAG: Holliday junction resolvase RuvX [Candidatus Coatesbacteria bacterium]
MRGSMKTLDRTILCFDYGDVRTGVAIAHKGTTVAMPVETLETENLFDEEFLKKYIEGRGAGLIVVGDPLSLSREITESTRKARAFAEMIRSITGVEVKMFDERLTTKQAMDGLKTRRGKKISVRDIDASSAVIILQCYIQSITKSY